MEKSAYFVTPSYDRDFERCRMLTESRGVCAPDIDHYIIVDPHDLALFRTLSNNRTHIIDSREIIDPSFTKLIGRNGWWISPRWRPVRGWIMQQLRKLAISRIVDQDMQINLDSDVTFIRHFNAGMLCLGDDLALFEVDFRNTEIVAWAETGARLTGVKQPSIVMNYVGMLISWWRETVFEMTAAIEAKHGMPWQSVIAREKSFSEYMMYGTYVRQQSTLSDMRHFGDQRVLVQNSWGHATQSQGDLEKLFAAAPPEAVAVMVHSKDNVDPAMYRRFVEQEWRRIS